MTDLQNVELIKRLIKPYKKAGDDEFSQGWNKAREEMEKNYKKYVQPVYEKMQEDMDKYYAEMAEADFMNEQKTLVTQLEDVN